tara:strand:+ start:70 stop:450 length:381 start_codon:yes stop_codon:yes gene_type:complete
VASFGKKEYNILVKLFLKEPVKINYPEQYGLAKKLLTHYPDIKFWQSSVLAIKRSILNSLAWFLTQDGINFLEDSHNYFVKIQKLDKNVFVNESIPLKKERVGKSMGFKNKKKKSLMDFINDAEKK